MKNFILIILLGLLITGCSTSSNSQTPIVSTVAITEVPCPGVEPRGVSVGMQAYFTVTGDTWSAPIRERPALDSNFIGNLFHHVRVKLMEGPNCAQNSAWWKVASPDGLNGWVQIGSELKGEKGTTTAALLPFTGDAVQQDVPEVRKLEAQVRYILADIELGGDDVFKYYQEQLSARPDDPEMESVKIVLKIIQESGNSNILANPSAFERKPLRGGTSVVDLGTEFVQPGLDILLKPCDIPNPSVAACKRLSQ